MQDVEGRIELNGAPAVALRFAKAPEELEHPGEVTVRDGGIRLPADRVVEEGKRALKLARIRRPHRYPQRVVGGEGLEGRALTQCWGFRDPLQIHVFHTGILASVRRYYCSK